MQLDPCRVVAKSLFGFALLLSVFGPIASPTPEPPKPVTIAPASIPAPMIAHPPKLAHSEASISAVAVTPTPTPKIISRRPVAPNPVSSSVVVQASRDEVIATITYWANYYGIDPAWMLRVAKCESGYSVTALNRNYYAGGGNPTGIFQFLPQTFAANAARVGIANPNIWDYRQQAQVAAWMFKIGQSRQWQCK